MFYGFLLLYPLLSLCLEHVISLSKKGKPTLGFVIMRNAVDIKTLSDVKDRVKNEKRTHCLVVNKYKVNDVLKNKEAKFYFLNVFRFPSVLKLREYEGNLMETGQYNGEVLRFIHSYVERLGGGGTHVGGKADSKADGKVNHDVSDQVVAQQTDQQMDQQMDQQTDQQMDQQMDQKRDAALEDCRLIPLNARFNKALQELMQREGKEIMEGLDMHLEEGDAGNVTVEGVAMEDDSTAHDSVQRNEGKTPKGPLDGQWPPLEELFRIIKKEGIQISIIQLQFGYDNMNTSEILRKIFPTESEVIHKYEMIGHIAHLNFCERFENYKKVIAEIILDKNKSIKTVINKMDTLKNLHRTFNIELLAGEKNYLTTLKENDIKVKLNYELIYWNSKLKKERDRIYDLVENNSIIVDLFAGVGIFSLHLSKKKCLCFSNDINSHAYNFMNVNIKLNKRKSILTYNLDARAFVQMLLGLDIFSSDKTTLSMQLSEQNWKNISLDFINSPDQNNVDTGKRKKRESDRVGHVDDDITANATIDKKKKLRHADTNDPLEERPLGLAATHHGEENIQSVERTNNDSEKTKEDAPRDVTHQVDINLGIYGDIHVLMNLPQTAFEFLDIFRELLDTYSTDQKDFQGKCRRDQMRNVFIHCYFFSKPELFYEDAERNIRMQLGGLPREMKITEIRKVSPSKLMYVAEFNLKDVF
ncbi:met-10+ like protein, putative [Plasmodium knowlesi strain H]|uniref:tRNA (guanine(37)-N(1))-methyltransferase n=4 Tax=Plasmodium knowlesi TaxID=5850 RepID=TRM5_PLAKH|nr:met-10+ like protein, putative [Plasmodium knowlesi strain H]B3L2G0.1 RecName: Full=tRNA (guanine(37)-N1)-methyltransferase; AltName: Full=M1G-methyltransferase; AltName: Full=tRNA [GM37] methyltransferase; AltName: Full=tRNA methyltransferase 5 homolog [Plasmodium knowlesi strain H]OTN67434.1 tRNA (guanine(37)-N1)-methyltransferase [Plasmodium knowlesi]CAA9987413.1 met-10+ like protein, putative [Plasmodium knowlesi strain H]SBO23285.1 met-10+ like protein, putative [Plasmodium knowlesi str|eukprot:XP_002258414.1 met-10+ like protein, putative [Plasmodium knowlesi strain H]